MAAASGAVPSAGHQCAGLGARPPSPCSDGRPIWLPSDPCGWSWNAFRHLSRLLLPTWRSD
eukprot:10572974-Alexandrium_andersonii.AAC.1